MPKKNDDGFCGINYYMPYYYDAVNFHAGCYVPSELHDRENAVFAMMQRSLFQRAASAIKLTVPKEWEGSKKDFLYWCLTRVGFVYVGKSDVYDKFFQPCTLEGYNFYYQPTHCLITNPYNKDEDLKGSIELGKRGTLIKWTPDFMGIWDLINLYAERLALMVPVTNISIRNNAMAWVYMAKTPQAAAAFKKAMDNIYSGKPGVVVDKGQLLDDGDDLKGADPFAFLDRKNIAQSYILDKLLQDFTTILNEFDAEVGIPTVPYAKKERMVTDEANSRQLDAQARSLVWVECLQSSIKELNEIFGEDFGLKAELRYKPDEGGESDVDSKNDDNRNGAIPQRSE